MEGLFGFLAIVAAGIWGWNLGTVLGNIVVDWWEDTTGSTLPG